MSLVTAYSGAVGRDKEPEKPEESPAVVNLGIQQQRNWLINQHTQEVFRQIGIEINKLETEARTLAVQYPQHQNAHGIIQRLVRAAELRNLVDKHGKVNT